MMVSKLRVVKALSSSRVVRRFKFSADSTEIEIEKLKKENIEIHDGYMFKIDELRGRICGLLSNDGYFKRLLQTALDATTAEKPAIKVIQERLEDAIKLMDKEYKKVHDEQMASRARR